MPMRIPTRVIGAWLTALLAVAVAGALLMCRGGARAGAGADASSSRPLVVSLSPNATEMVFALGCGDLLVGRSSACDYPAAALEVPSVGSFGNPSLDQIASLRPRYVLSTLAKGSAFRANLARFGIEYVELPCARLADYETCIRTLGGLLGCSERAAAEIERFRGKIEPIREKTAALPEAGRPRVYLEVWNRPLKTCGRDSFVGDLIECAGGINIGKVQAQDYWTCSDEWVIAADPEVIICPSMGAGAPAEVAARTGWGDVAAVKSGRVHSGIDPSLVFRLGPRTPEAVVILHGLIHPGGGESGKEDAAP
jgi:iron complex transport system substrate-binding protein